MLVMDAGNQNGVEKDYLKFFKDEDLNNIPVNYFFFERLQPKDFISADIYKFTLSSEYHTQKYFVTEYHRPISKILRY